MIAIIKMESIFLYDHLIRTLEMTLGHLNDLKQSDFPNAR